MTAKEISDIESLQKKYEVFTYAMTPSTEAFPKENSDDADGEVGGYAALFCEWLTRLFGIRFQPVIYAWGDLYENLSTGEIDFAGNITPNAERRKIFHMTDPVADRQYKTIRLTGSPSLDPVALNRPLRYVFIEGAAIAANVAAVTASGSYEAVFVKNYEEAYRALESGQADAFIGDSAVVSSFDNYGNVYANDFLPLIFSPVSMATAKDDLEPVISVVTKALRKGAIPYLNYLYNQGYQEYQKNKFFLHLNEGEKAYLRNPSPVPLAARYFNYPIDFYNTYEKKWQGLAFDVLHEVEKLTGLSFVVVNGLHENLSELYEMVRVGRAHLVPELLMSNERKKHYIWTETKFITDQYALISKSQLPNVSTNEISNMRVGLIKDTVRAGLFYTWFPNASNVIEYETDEKAMFAMERGEVEMVMSSKNRLISYLNYYGLSDYKANYLFNYPYEATFGFTKDQTDLCSIVDKALSLIDTYVITEQWMTKTYDYKTKLMEAQRPWLIGAIVMSLATLSLILILFLKTRGEGKRLEKLVAERTEEVRKASLEAHNASEAKSHFLANMSHEMRTPMNLIVGLTDLMIEEDDPVNVKEALGKINTAGATLMDLINDVLDISKIESGKMELTPVKYHVASLLNDVMTLNMIRLEGKPVTFKLDVNEDMPSSLFGDDLRVKQILNNLLSNAFKYTKKGSVTLSVSVEESSPRSPVPVPQSLVWVTFSISDTGIGIRGEDIEKLFTDYNQVDIQSNREIKGTGLGLSITKKFVELMGGEIFVESEYGKGTTFRVNIPQGFVSDTPIGKETAENLRTFRYTDNLTQSKLIRPDLSFARVLLVDDFSANFDVAVEMLRKYKMQVDCVTSGREAVDSIKAGEPVYNAVFMDQMMPEMDGIEATKLIRAIDTDYAGNIPIIALTANAVAGNERMFLESGFNAFLPKPYSMKMLDAVVQKWVKKSEQ